MGRFTIYLPLLGWSYVERHVTKGNQGFCRSVGHRAEVKDPEYKIEFCNKKISWKRFLQVLPKRKKLLQMFAKISLLPSFGWPLSSPPFTKYLSRRIPVLFIFQDPIFSSQDIFCSGEGTSCYRKFYSLSPGTPSPQVFLFSSLPNFWPSNILHLLSWDFQSNEFSLVLKSKLYLIAHSDGYLKYSKFVFYLRCPCQNLQCLELFKDRTLL